MYTGHERTALKAAQLKLNPSHSSDTVICTNNLIVYCTKLPQHWRSNKSLPSMFKVYINSKHCEYPAQLNGCLVTLVASNQSTPNAILRNYDSKIINGEARFNDLRFISRSGRGKYFDLEIHIDSKPRIHAIYSNAIKVTVDGPREPRNKNSKSLYLATLMPNSEMSPNSRDSRLMPQVIPKSYDFRQSLSNETCPVACPAVNSKPPLSLPNYTVSQFRPVFSPDYLTLLHLLMTQTLQRNHPGPTITPHSLHSTTAQPKPKIWRPF